MQVGSERSVVTALTFPADDAVFGERVREIMVETGGAPVGVVLTKLDERLRRIHPKVATRLRSEVAGFGPKAVVYVFRDGTALPHQSDDRWLEEPTAARVVTDAAGTYVAANDAASTLFGVTMHDIVGRRAGTFTQVDSRIEDAHALWSALATKGRLHSLSLVERPDGSEIPVEFVTVQDGDGPGRHVTLLRALE